MDLNVEKELAALRRMSVGQVRQRYAEVFGEPTRSRHKQWLVKRTLWRMQASYQSAVLLLPRTIGESRALPRVTRVDC